jgi:hypothetical protein
VVIGLVTTVEQRERMTSTGLDHKTGTIARAPPIPVHSSIDKMHPGKFSHQYTQKQQIKKLSKAFESLLCFRFSFITI